MDVLCIYQSQKLWYHDVLVGNKDEVAPGYHHCGLVVVTVNDILILHVPRES